jgi:hypothetical protein
MMAGGYVVVTGGLEIIAAELNKFFHVLIPQRFDN